MALKTKRTLPVKGEAKGAVPGGFKNRGPIPSTSIQVGNSSIPTICNLPRCPGPMEGSDNDPSPASSQVGGILYHQSPRNKEKREGEGKNIYGLPDMTNREP